MQTLASLFTLYSLVLFRIALASVSFIKIPLLQQNPPDSSLHCSAIFHVPQNFLRYLVSYTSEHEGTGPCRYMQCQHFSEMHLQVAVKWICIQVLTFSLSPLPAPTLAHYFLPFFHLYPCSIHLIQKYLLSSSLPGKCSMFSNTFFQMS